ncbi:MAG: hypothetical protein ACIAQF_13080 [Phycisphaerales bacterium JB065]
MRTELEAIIEAVVSELESAGVFESVRKAGDDEPEQVLIVATAKDTPEPVYYRLELAGDQIAVGWYSPDRYLSQSIETDILWTGDDLDDLIDEELVDLGWDRGRLRPLKHFRNDEMLFTFVSATPIVAQSVTQNDAEDLARVMLAYEIAFRELGDMAGDEDED